MSANDGGEVEALDTVVFKKPAPLPSKSVKKRKLKVLDEECYLDEMGKIIQRDFFPDLEKVKAQNEYLDAVAKNDFVKMREIYNKYNRGGNDGSERLAYSPATFETPVNNGPRDDDGADMAQVERVLRLQNQQLQNKKESLDQYLSNHTSEDNQSFDDLLEEAEARHKRKYGWLYKEDSSQNEESHKKRLVLLEVGEAFGKSKLDMWPYKDKNYLMYVPNGVELTPEELVERAKCRQEISHCNTRFRVKPFDESENKERIQDLAIIQQRTLDGKVGVDGKELVSDVPVINGYSFVKTPSPAPGIDNTPLMTWGEIEGTPFRLDGSDTPLRSTPGLSYSMPEPPTREKIAMLLSDKVSEQHRDKKKRAMEAARKHLAATSPMHRPGSLDRLQTLSPAARKMSHSITRLSSDKKLSSFYSPSSVRQEPTTPVPSGSKTPHSTPIASPQQTITTDNLLNIPVKKRPTAVDFFK